MNFIFLLQLASTFLILNLIEKTTGTGRKIKIVINPFTRVRGYYIHDWNNISQFGVHLKCSSAENKNIKTPFISIDNIYLIDTNVTIEIEMPKSCKENGPIYYYISQTIKTNQGIKFQHGEDYYNWMCAKVKLPAVSVIPTPTLTFEYLVDQGHHTLMAPVIS